MIITCPECGSRYLLGAHALGPQGRHVRCANCEHTWFQESDEDETAQTEDEHIEPIPDSIKPVQEGASVPALADGKLAWLQRPVVNAVLSAVTLFVLLLTPVFVSADAAVQAWPPFAKLFDGLGVAYEIPGESLVFERIHAQYTSNSDDQPGRLEVKGRLINLSSAAQNVYGLKFQLVGSDGTARKTWRSGLETDVLKGEQSLQFQDRHAIDVRSGDRIIVQPFLPGLDEGGV